VIARGASEGGTDLGGIERVVGRREEVAEQKPVLQSARPDLDQLQPFQLGQPSACAAQAKDLAAIGPALRRQPP
jgi:hypothetical protein